MTHYYVNDSRVTKHYFDVKYISRVSERWIKTRSGTLIVRILL